ncbi:MAG: tetratricopeptide repeat protein [Candidatus Peribacteraceae bacterium]|nr:tetratricopeptide repeat protein [Candidatus Peribacteraceae bacterium]MDD5075264.1 tetratricopeptide repeat protein [Candidatus Peribacteraceae bacterium]
MHAQHSPDTLERLERAEQLKLMGKHEEALAILEQLLIEDPENVPALEEVADNEVSLNHYARAERAAKQAVQICRKSYTGHYILGFIRSHENAWTEALKELREANSMSPNNPEILRCLGWALFHAGQRAQGVVTLERALNLDQGNPLTLCDLGVAYLHVHNIVKATSLFQRAIEIDPENDRAKEGIQMAKRLEKQKMRA